MFVVLSSSISSSSRIHTGYIDSQWYMLTRYTLFMTWHEPGLYSDHKYNNYNNNIPRFINSHIFSTGYDCKRRICLVSAGLVHSELVADRTIQWILLWGSSMHFRWNGACRARTFLSEHGFPRARGCGHCRGYDCPGMGQHLFRQNWRNGKSKCQFVKLKLTWMTGVKCRGRNIWENMWGRAWNCLVCSLNGQYSGLCGGT